MKKNWEVAILVIAIAVVASVMNKPIDVGILSVALKQTDSIVSNEIPASTPQQWWLRKSPI